MTIDPNAILGISLATLLAIIGATAIASATWTKLGMRMQAMSDTLAELAKSMRRATAEANDDLDDVVTSFTTRHERHSERLRMTERRLDRLEHIEGIPMAIDVDRTPVTSEPVTGRHRVVRKSPDESR